MYTLARAAAESSFSYFETLDLMNWKAVATAQLHFHQGFDENKQLSTKQKPTPTQVGASLFWIFKG